jgi:hypothetical protein
MPTKPDPKRLYAKPMIPSDAARTIERVALILRAEADRFEREVMRLNQRAMVTRSEAERLQQFQDMRIPRIVTPANAKPHVPGTGRPRKTTAKANV